MEYNLAHTVRRGGTYYYNRRVPKSVSSDFGQTVVRVSLGQDPERVARLSKALKHPAFNLRHIRQP